eukprot:TRINITY_DN5223_c0_g1_i7.p1 TRINITY_DN5223_c0_g1~~TRINITY_DN5223_c0_g1_i7.p1  ORF type:complete len:192 (+),score=29.36 TRINITY_DN5223_c0_g1_i7:150-725(+)
MMLNNVFIISYHYNMYVWDTASRLATSPNSCGELPTYHDPYSPFGLPLWRTLPVDSSAEELMANPFVATRERDGAAPEQTGCMNELKEMWDESSRRSVQSVCFGSEDETTTGSLIESRVSFQKGDMECPSSIGKLRIANSLLSDLVPAAELAERKLSEITSQLTNEKKGFINIIKLSSMIARSLDMESVPL